MEVPQIPHKQFLLLSTLIDGREKALREIRDEIQYKGFDSDFSMRFRTLHVHGLVEKFDVVRRVEDDPPKFRRERVVRITEYGREIWEETADFYAWVIEHFSAETDTGDGQRVIHRKPVPASTEAESRQRARECFRIRARRAKRYAARRAEDEGSNGRKDNGRD